MSEETLSSKNVFKGDLFSVRVDEICMPDGCISTREIVEHGDAVAVVPIDKNGNILLVRQYRRAAEKDPLETVKRELQEEIGYFPNKVIKLGGFYASPGYNTEYLYLYFASDLVPAKLHAEDTDSIEVVPVPVKSITDYIKSGKICDSKSVAGILYYMFLK